MFTSHEWIKGIQVKDFRLEALKSNLYSIENSFFHILCTSIPNFLVNLFGGMMPIMHHMQIQLWKAVQPHKPKRLYHFIIHFIKQLIVNHEYIYILWTAHLLLIWNQKNLLVKRLDLLFCTGKCLKSQTERINNNITDEAECCGVWVQSAECGQEINWEKF